jgi:hypothetical protein
VKERPDHECGQRSTVNENGYHGPMLAASLDPVSGFQKSIFEHIRLAVLAMVS